jgi:zinc transport system permease protein
VSEFFEAVGNHQVLFNAFLAGVLASIACGVVGTYVVNRRMTYLAGGIAHSVLGGIGVAHYLSQVHGLAGVRPIHGAVVAALVAAVVIGLVSLRAREKEDTVISAVWAVGMAVGLIFITGTPGSDSDLVHYLFGDILMVSGSDLRLIVALDALVVMVGVLFYRQLLAVCFDEEFARIRGIKVELYYLLLLCLSALTIVVMVSVVGIILVIALLTLPAAIAGYFTRSFWKIMVAASVLSMIFTTAGLGISYKPNLPAGAVIVILAGATYLTATVAASLRKARTR